MRTVHLYGHLAELFGKSFRLEVFSAAEAVRALEANFRGRFYKALAMGEYHIITGSDIRTGESYGEDMLTFGLGDKDLHIMPVLAGSKDSGLFKIVAGVVLVVVGYFTGGSTTKLGLALIVSGMADELSSTMDLPRSGVRNTVDPRASFVLQGAENVAAQGGPVPVVYGKYLVGSTVISTSIVVEDVL